MTIVREDLVEALAALPPLDRRVLLMRERQRLSYNQISAVLGIPFDAVADRVSAARQQLLRYQFVSPARSTPWRSAHASAGCRG